MILVLISLCSGYVAPHARTQQATPRACGSRFARRGAACASVVRVEESVLDDPMFLDEAALLASKGRRRAVRMPCTRRAHSAPCAVRIPYTRLCAGFAIAPDDLIKLAKNFLVSRGGFGADPELLSPAFQFIAPVVGPLGKEEVSPA